MKFTDSRHLMNSNINVHLYIINQLAARLNYSLYADKRLLYLSFSYIITKVFTLCYQIRQWNIFCFYGANTMQLQPMKLIIAAEIQ